jgi:hypothetical protein
MRHDSGAFFPCLILAQDLITPRENLFYSENDLMLSHQNLPIRAARFRSLTALKKALLQWRESGRKRTVLIIEDQDEIREALVEAASAEGHHVVAAKDRVTGVSLLNAAASLHAKAQDFIWISASGAQLH